MKKSRSYSKCLCFLLVALAFSLFYIGVMVVTYNRTVKDAQVDISIDVFERKQKAQQKKHLELIREFTNTLRAQKRINENVETNIRVNHDSDGQSRQPNGRENTVGELLKDNNDDIRGKESNVADQTRNRLSDFQSRDKVVSHTEEIPIVHHDEKTEMIGNKKTLPDRQNDNPIVTIPKNTKSLNGLAPHTEKTRTTTAHTILDDIIVSGNVSIKYGENQDSGSGTYRAFWVQTNGSFLQRVTNFNAAIHQIRKELISARGGKEWQPLSGPIESLWCNRDDFQNELGKYPLVKTISLAWHSKVSSDKDSVQWDSSADRDNILLQSYFGWTGSESLCRWVRTAGLTKARWDAVYNRTCKLLLQEPTAKHYHLEPVYLHGKPINKNHYWPHHGMSYPRYFYTTTPPQVMYMHIIEDAVVTSLGDVISGNLKLVPYSCSQDVGVSPPPKFQLSPLYDEVFIMGQYWGASFFHLMIENLPRITPYLEFLKANPGVLIHAQSTDRYTAKSIELLGLNRTRLIKGTVRARRVFLSQATPCGFAHLPSIQILALRYRNFLQGLSPPLPARKRTLLLIRRSGSRRFTQHLRIREELETVAMEFDLDFELFIDNPSPSMQTAMVMFNRAMLVVGPHGAGLSNLVYCKPGTLVIEGVCNPPHVNMCYQWTAHVLGLRYHGIASRGGCETLVDVDYQQVAAAARQLLRSFTNRS